MFLFPYLAHVPVYEMVAAYEKPELLLIYVPSCPYCRQVLDYLNKAKMTIPMCNVQVDKGCKSKLIQQGGIAQVPCLFINDQPIYDPDAIIQWLHTNEDKIKSLPHA